MTMPMSSEVLSGIIRWPIFLLANKVHFLKKVCTQFVFGGYFGLVGKYSYPILLVFNSSEHCERL